MSIILTCFLTVRPNELFYNFVKILPNIENTYICIDDNEYSIPNYDGKVKIIKINNDDCEKVGFKNTHSKIQGATSREKAFYYFYKNNIQYDYIWFIEEDVFIPTTETIKNIDTNYPTADLLIRSHELCLEKRSDWWWNKINQQLKNKIKLPFAWAKGAGVCAVRCSKKMLESIFEHALKYKTLFFCEVMFNILALKSNLDVKAIKELNTIVHRKKNGWQKSQIKKSNLYHPVKSIERQYELR